MACGGVCNNGGWLVGGSVIMAGGLLGGGPVLMEVGDLLTTQAGHTPAEPPPRLTRLQKQVRGSVLGLNHTSALRFGAPLSLRISL